MRTLIVVESMWGNTRRVAEAVAAGLPGEVSVVDVADAPPTIPDVDLLLMGGPTHAFSMSRPGTRQDAVGRGASGDPATGLREWLDALRTAGRRPRTATFSTKVDKRFLPGDAARSAAKAAKDHGLTVVDHGTFLVHDYAGPLIDGEETRATEWGRALGRGHEA